MITLAQSAFTSIFTNLAATDSNTNILVLLIGVAILLMLFWYFATEKLVRKRNIGTVIVAVIAVSCVFAIVSPSNLWTVIQGKDVKNDKGEIVKWHNLEGGIDIVGGTSVLMEVVPNEDINGDPLPIRPEDMRSAQDRLSERIDTYGGLNAVINIVGTNRLEVQIPKIDPERAEEVIKKLTTAAKLTIHEAHPLHNSGSSFEAHALAKKVFDGEEIVPTYKAYPQNKKNEKGVFIKDKDGNYIVDKYFLVKRRVSVKGSEIEFAQASTVQPGTTEVTLTSKGADDMIDFTSNMKQGELIVTILDGYVVSAASLNAPTLGKRFVITGGENKAESEKLAEALNNPLENDIKVVQQQSVSATLGEATVHQGINAGIYGLGLTLIFVLLYYRFAGIIALLGLTLNILILFGAMAGFGASFTLPGIAGIILTIGVAVDANVLIYERMREELALGKSVKSAIAAAYEKAFSAILDANITTLITAIILFWQASGSVKGFAVTLTIGILGTLLAALLCTRVLFWWSADTGILKDIKFMSIVPKGAIDFLSKRKICFILSSVLLIVGLSMVGVKNKDNLGVDFNGGRVLRFEIPETEAGKAIKQQQVNDAVDHLELEKGHSSQIEEPSELGLAKESRYIKVTCGDSDEDEAALTAAVTKEFKITATPSSEKVSSALGKEFLQKAIWALALGMFCVLIYITIRFEFSFAVGAFFALFHDILIVLGLLFILDQELTLIHISAFLTIIGYSINDTIIVFDRIRENLKTKRGEVKDIMNDAISSTLSRTILTSVTTFVAVLVLYIFGGSALKDFSLTIMIGVVVGTYSSIFIASPTVYIFSKMRGTNLRRELLDANLEAEVNPSKA